MLSILVATLIAAPLQGPDLSEWGSLKEIPGYRPSFISNGLAVGTLTGVHVRDDSCRGYRTSDSHYVIHLPFLKVARGLCTDMEALQLVDKLTDDQLSRRRSIVTDKVLSDRVITVFAMPGRPVVVRAPNSISHEFADQDAYTHVKVVESPLKVGRMPASWPEMARRANPLPKASWACRARVCQGSPIHGPRAGPKSAACSIWRHGMCMKTPRPFTPGSQRCCARQGIGESPVKTVDGTSAARR